jgi:pimeloyl-ACP methyl ester carboxylesterase
VQFAAPHLLGYGEYRSTPFQQISLPAQIEHIRAFIGATFGAATVERSHDNWNVPHWTLQKSAGHETLDRCGHLMMIENPTAFSAAISAFLNQPTA